MSSSDPPPGTGHTPNVSFRSYRLGDIPACARLARDAWPAGPVIDSEELGLAGMEGYMEYSLGASNWAEIASTSEGVVGFLFGRIDNYSEAPAPKTQSLGEIPSLLKSFFERRQTDPRLLAFVWSLALTELKLKLNTPKSDAAIEMLIVDSRHRGGGIGSALMERFLMAAKGAGSSLVTVYTDDLMSDWQFYERRGFRKVATFHDNITSHYSGSRARGIVFAKNLEGSDPSVPRCIRR